MTCIGPCREDACGPSSRTLEMAQQVAKFPGLSLKVVSGWPMGRYSRERAKPRIRVNDVRRSQHESHSEGPDDWREFVFGVFQLAFTSPYCQPYTGYCCSTVQSCRRKGKAWNVSLRRLTRTVVPPYSAKVSTV